MKTNIQFLSTFIAATLSMQSVLALERVSISSNGNQGNGKSGHQYLDSQAISADGNYVVFSSGATNLVQQDTNGKEDIFVHNRITGTTERVSISGSGVQGNGHSQFPSISDDGRYIVFQSEANNLVANDNNNSPDIFIRDLTSGNTELVSVSSGETQGNGMSTLPWISGDGNSVSFASFASNLVAADTNNHQDIFVRNLQLGETKRVNISSGGIQANKNSRETYISQTGRYVVFSSFAENLVPGDTNTWSDIFVHDMQNKTTERVNLSSSGIQADWHTYEPAISADGRFVVFESYANNLIDGAYNSGGTFSSGIYIHDRMNKTTRLVNGSITRIGRDPSISYDGQYVAFKSYEGGLVSGDTNNAGDVFVYDQINDTTVRVSESNYGAQIQGAYSEPGYPVISGNGEFVVFSSKASTLVEDDTNALEDVFISAFNANDDLTVMIAPTMGVIQLGEKIKYRARFTNNTDEILTNCKAKLINPLVNWQRQFSYYHWPLNVTSPSVNGGIDIMPGETGSMNLVVEPRVPVRQEVKFDYSCDNYKHGFSIPFQNTAHLTAKATSLVDQDYIQVRNSNSKTMLNVDLSDGRYWKPYVINVINTGVNPTRTDLLMTTNIYTDTGSSILRQHGLCEPTDPENGNWKCLRPRSHQLNVELQAGQTKKIVGFVALHTPLGKNAVSNQLYVEAHDGLGEIVAKNSIRVSADY